jgi:hypothetical protein
MSRSDRIALLFSLIAVILSFLVTEKIFEGVPHLEDELAYAWQAQVITHGQLRIASPEDASSFFVPFVIDYQGWRFSKYPLGWPILLALGVKLGVRGLVNPLLAGLGVWLIYLLGKRVTGSFASLLAAGLTLTSPFFLINSGSLLSHPLGLVLSAALALVWLDGFGEAGAPRRWLSTLTAAGLVGALVITRPLTALGVALPFAFHGLVLFIKGNRQTRLHLTAAALLSLGLCGLHFAWQYALTGNAQLNPYALVWPYDRVGFGPGFGVRPEGHTLLQGLLDTSHSLQTGWRDLFGWAGFSWIMLPFGVWALRRKWQALLVGSVFVSLVIVYLAYWVGADLFGPRYFYEGLYSLTLFSGAGAAWIMGKGTPEQEIRDKNPVLRLRLGAGMLAALVLYNLVFFLPGRLEGMVGLNGISRVDIQLFQKSQMPVLAPALVIVTPKSWTSYAALLELEDPWLDTPIIFALTRGPETDARLAQDYPDRLVLPYSPGGQ